MRQRGGERQTRRWAAIGACMVTLAFGMAARASAQEDPIKWSVGKAPESVVAGHTFRLEMTATIAEGWHLYSVTQAPPPIATRLAVAKDQPFTLDGAIDGPTPEVAFDQGFGMDTEFYAGKAVFTLPVKVDVKAAGKQVLHLTAYYQSCNNTMCLPPKTVKLETPAIDIKAASAAAVAAANAAAAAAPPPAAQPPAAAVAIPRGNANAPLASGAASQSAPAAQPPGAPSSSAPAVPASGLTGTAAAPTSAAPGRAAAAASAGPAMPGTSGSLWSFLWLAMTMGAVSLLTPCVFPMVPITVSYFTRDAGGSRGRAVGQALTYMAGIILTFTAIGMAMALLVGATSLNHFAASPWVNLAITMIFVAFALNLFGFYEIAIPSSVLTKLDGMSQQSEGGGVGRTVATLLMALTFTLTSFTCTAPFIGTLLVMAAAGDWQWPLLGMLAFSMVFALPFFILALMPHWLSKLPRSGSWMNSVKVMMAFVVVAASMKFLANADVVWRWGIFTRDVVLGVWVTVGLMMMGYVLGLFRFPHDSPVKSVGLVRLATGLVCGTLAFWLVSGLTGKPLGELDSLLPLSAGGTVAAAGAGEAEMKWFVNDYDGALAEAQRTNRRVFIDFSGYTCTNCKWMETNMFPRAAVQREFKNFVLVRLYTDGEGEVYQRQQQMQQAKYQTVATPYYAILAPNGDSVASFAGLTRDENQFVGFLKKGLT